MIHAVSDNLHQGRRRVSSSAVLNSLLFSSAMIDKSSDE
jgi:hypothetical protein